MNNILKFPASNNQVANLAPSKGDLLISASERSDETFSYLSSRENDYQFFILLKKWPCFFGMQDHITFHDILEMYYNNELNPSQNYVLEYLFHMHDSTVHFDIA